MRVSQPALTMLKSGSLLTSWLAVKPSTNEATQKSRDKLAASHKRQRQLEEWQKQQQSRELLPCPQPQPQPASQSHPGSQPPVHANQPVQGLRQDPRLQGLNRLPSFHGVTKSLAPSWQPAPASSPSPAYFAPSQPNHPMNLPPVPKNGPMARPSRSLEFGNRPSRRSNGANCSSRPRSSVFFPLARWE